MRLIDADALEKAITEHCRSEVECLNHLWYDENIIALIENAPTIEKRPQGRPLNDAINIIKETCKNYKTCVECPMNFNCNEHPAEWKEAKGDDNG